MRHLAVLLVILAAQSALAEPVYTGPELQTLASQNTNAMYGNLLLLRAMMESNFGGLSSGVTVRSTPARFRMATGEEVEGGLSRTLYFGGGAFGDMRNGQAFVWTLQWDLASANVEDTLNAMAGEMLLSAGYAFHGLVVDAGVTMSTVIKDGFNAAGEFKRTEEADVVFRQGAPRSATQRHSGSLTEDIIHRTGFLTLYHASGVSVGGSLQEWRDSVADEKRFILAAARGMFQPARLLREIALFGAGLDYVAAHVDLYGERITENGRLLPTVPGATARWDVPLSLDNIFGTGLRTRLVTEVSPLMRFRLAELTLVRTLVADEGGLAKLRYGARVQAFRRNEDIEQSFDGFVATALGPGNIAFYLAFAYSYNSPDTATFFPVPRASVIGFQFGLGLVDAFHPIVPIADEPWEWNGSKMVRPGDSESSKTAAEGTL